MESTRNILSNLYDALLKKTAVLVNKIPNEIHLQPEGDQETLVSSLEETLKHPVIGLIPCYCDVLKAERTSMLAFEKPGHPFITKLEEILDKLEITALKGNKLRQT
jgi:hypothetical protein